MKIFQNIIPVIKLCDSLRYLSEFKKEIAKARATGDLETERVYILKSTSTWGKHLVKSFDIILNISGKEFLPETSPVVFVSNHQGYADIPVTCAVLDRFQFGYVAKSDLQKVPFYGKWIERIRSVFIKRDDSRASLRAIAEGIDLIEKGFSLLIFPEGTRSKGEPVAEFKKGSLRLATKPGVPVVPITLSGTYKVFEEYGYIRNGVTVDVVIHPVIETAGMDKTEAGDLTLKVEEIIKGGFLWQ